MNCPTCKNPIEVHSEVCEWCGKSIHTNKGFDKAENQPYLIHFFYKVDWWHRHPSSLSLMIFVDDLLIHEFIANDGCDFKFNLANNNPIIHVSLDKGLNKHVLKLHVGYLRGGWDKIKISWKQNWLGVVYFDNPTIFLIP